MCVWILTKFIFFFIKSRISYVHEISHPFTSHSLLLIAASWFPRVIRRDSHLVRSVVRVHDELHIARRQIRLLPRLVCLPWQLAARHCDARRLCVLMTS